MLSIDNENDLQLNAVASTIFSPVEMNNTSKVIHTLSPTWLQQGLNWPPKHQGNK